MQPVLRAVRAGGALVGDEALDMGRVLELRAAIEAAPMRGDQLSGVEDTHGVQRGQHQQGAVGVRVRDRVVVPVEAHVRGLARAHLEALFARERVGGQSEQIGPLLFEDFAHAAAALFRAGPLSGRCLTPG